MLAAGMRTFFAALGLGLAAVPGVCVVWCVFEHAFLLLTPSGRLSSSRLQVDVWYIQQLARLLLRGRSRRPCQ